MSQAQWDRLLEFLNGWCLAIEVAPGRIDVTLPERRGRPRSVEIRMTPDEWDDIASVAVGSFHDAAQMVREQLLGMRDGDKFLVYGQYDLTPLPAPELPIDPDEERLAELARQHPEGFGRWSTRRPDGIQVYFGDGTSTMPHDQ